MSTPLTEQAAPELRHTLMTLQSLPGVDAVRPFSNGFSVECPGADFVIRIRPSENAPVCETEWEVTVRESLPGLNTWWGQWQRSFSVHPSQAAPLIVNELGKALVKVQDMLEDHVRHIPHE